MFSKKDHIKHMILERRRFVSLMDLYERNFNLICRLIPDLKLIPCASKTSIINYPDLYLKIQNRCKFTTMMNLTYKFLLTRDNSGSGAECIADPDLNIRVYHDARMVEAMPCKTKGFMSIKISHIGEQDQFECRWDSNIFLNKWLEYVTGIGYKFTPSTITEETVKGEELNSV